LISGGLKTVGFHKDKIVRGHFCQQAGFHRDKVMRSPFASKLAPTKTGSAAVL
jgi:hypothetical protein